jgi:hypothetical protein
VRFNAFRVPPFHLKEDTMPRVTGRVIRPATLAERRLMLSLGTPCIRVGRQHNPFIVSRRLARAARGDSPDVLFLRDVATGKRKPRPPKPSPHPDTPEPKPGPIETRDVAHS